jgi:small-conductance mechanosensitive channel
MDPVGFIRRFVLILILLAVVTFSMVFLFDQLIAARIGLSALFAQTVRAMIVVVFGSFIILFIRRSKSLMSKYVGIHPTTVFQFLMVLVVGIVMVFAVLNIFQVSPTALLLSGGIVSIVMGLVISTFVGNILAGTLLFMTSHFRVGDDVLVNNVPGKIVEITAMVTRIRNDVGGQIVIPNTAIVQGGVIVTKIPAGATVAEGRLPYSLGERVYTTYANAEGIVKELTPLYTKILLDSGREVTFLNTSILSGLVAVARISSGVDDTLKFSFKTDGDAEKTIKAVEQAAKSNPATFKSAPTLLYSSIDGKTVELEITCKVDPTRKTEAKSIILKTAYLSGAGTLRGRAKDKQVCQ